MPRIRKALTRGAVALALPLLAGAVPVQAEIAMLSNGRTLKVKSYQLSGRVMEFTLAGGGSVQLPIDRIERIIDDEVVPAEVADNLPAFEKKRVFPERNWGYREGSKPLFGSKFDKVITEAARKFNVDAALVSAVIQAESDYNPRIVSNKGARGLMQLMPATAERFGVTDSFDPVSNIYAGTRYLRWLLQTFDGDADLAVAAYNAGEGNVWKYNGVPPFRETINYIRRIARHFSADVAATATASIASATR
ncbi:MAG: lytic transglycosylase domain-containing protein [Acidobacteriota bacterium]